MKIMDIINLINAFVLIIGLPVLLKVAIDIGKKLQILDRLETDVGTLEQSISNLSSEMRELRNETSEMKSKLNLVWDWFSKYVINEKRA
jgi:uncharacterized protein YoxC